MFVVAVVVLGAFLAGCSLFEDPAPQPTVTGGVPTTPGATPTETPVPELVTDGDAVDNLPLFESVVLSVWESDDPVRGRAYIDALTEVGFDRDAMQVTQDQTTVGNAAESIQFSVRWGEAECLVGQVGPSTGDPVVAVMDQLAEGRCLVGETRAIDW